MTGVYQQCFMYEWFCRLFFLESSKTSEEDFNVFGGPWKLLPFVRGFN